MIAAFVLAYILADHPFVLTWEVQWNPPRKNTIDVVKFDEFFPALLMKMKAPLCQRKGWLDPRPVKTPCVVWVRLDIVKATEALRANESR